MSGAPIASRRRLSQAIFCVVVASLALTVTRSLTFSAEPALIRPQQSGCEEVVRRGFPVAVCEHEEMFNSAWGDSLEYFVMASGRASYPPYSLRPLYPKLVGALARLALPNDPDPIDPMRLFVRTSQVAGALNILLVALLAILPVIHFRAWSPASDTTVLALIMLNMIHIGVAQTAPFFMLDVPTYVVFTVAAGAFFRGRFTVLCIAAIVGVLIKEVSIVLLLPMAYLWWQRPDRRLARLPILALPALAFLGTRYLLGVDPLSVNYGWNVSKGDIRLDYLVSHLGSLRSAVGFLLQLSSALGASGVTALLVYRATRVARAEFAICVGLTGLVILADVLLASRVPRVVAVCIPFFVFYSVTAYLSHRDQSTA